MTNSGMKYGSQPRLRCRLGLHRWKWGGTHAFGYNAYQRRVCLRCGRMGEKKVGWATERENDEKYGRVGNEH